MVGRTITRDSVVPVHRVVEERNGPLFIKRFAILVAAVAVVVGVSATRAEAAFVLSNTFCSASTNPSGESTTCPTGLGATLTIETVDTAVNGVNDINDYYVTLTLDSTAVDRGQYFYISDVQFSIQGAQTGNAAASFGDYESVPTLDRTAVDGTGTWTVWFDTISGSVNSCTTDGNGTSTCAASTSPYTDTGDVDAWKFYVDFDDQMKAFITSSTDTNLRATFLKRNGSIGGILSPDWKNITGGTGGTGGGTPPDTAVPEPGSLLLLGSGLVLLGRRARKKMRRA